MTKYRQGMMRGKGLRHLLALLTIIVALSAAPRAFAACEPNGTLEDAGIALGDEQALNADWLAIGTAAGWVTDLDALRSRLGVMGRDRILQAMQGFWSRWRGAWVGMNRQLSAGTLYQTLQWGRYNDATNIAKTALELQKQKLKSKLLYQPTEETCRFDTVSRYLGPSREVSRAIESGYEWDVMKEGNNTAGTYGQWGPANMDEYLWRVYLLFFCDYRAEGGHGNPGCVEGSPRPWPNLDVLPGKMLFSKETIALGVTSCDLEDPPENLPEGACVPYNRIAVRQLIHNITGYKIPSPIMQGSMTSPQGVKEVLKRRAYLAQVNAMTAPLYSILGNRAPGVLAPEVRQMRIGQGQPVAYNYPSSREIRQVIVEQLWNPTFYKNLYDNPVTVAQKEVYLRAYNLMLLYDLIAKQEKISNVYAIQTSNLLEMQKEREKSRSSASAAAPMTGN